MQVKLKIEKLKALGTNPLISSNEKQNSQRSISSRRDCCGPKIQSLDSQRSTTQKKFIDLEQKDKKILDMADAYNDWSFLNNQKPNIQKFKGFNKLNAKNLDNIKLFQVDGGTYIAKKLWDDEQLANQTVVTKDERLKEKYQLKIKQNLVKESQIYKAKQEQEQNSDSNFQLEQMVIDPQEANYALISNRNNIRGVLDVNNNFLKVYVPVKTNKRKNASLERNSTDQKQNKLINRNSGQILQINSEKKIKKNMIPGEKKFQESMMLINEYQQTNRPIFQQIRSVIKPTQAQTVYKNKILKIPGGLANQFIHKKSGLDNYSQLSEVQEDRIIYAQSGPAYKVPLKTSPLNRADPNIYYNNGLSQAFDKEQNINMKQILNNDNSYDQSHESQTWNKSSPNNRKQSSLPQLANVNHQLSNHENISRDRQFGIKSKVDFLNSKNGTIEQIDADLRQKTLNIFDDRFDITQRRKQKEVNFLDGYQFMKAPTKSQEQLTGVKQMNKNKGKKYDNFLKQGILRKSNISEYQFENNRSGHSYDEFERSYDPNREPKPFLSTNIEATPIINIQTNASKSKLENLSNDQNTIESNFDRKKLFDSEMFKLTKRPSKFQKNGKILAPLTRNKSQDEVNELENFANRSIKVNKGAQTNLKGNDALPTLKKNIPWKPSGKINEDEMRKNSLSPPIQRSLENSPNYIKNKRSYIKKVFRNTKSKFQEVSTQTDNKMEIALQNEPNNNSDLPEIHLQKNIFESKPISKDDRQSKSLQLSKKKQRTDSSNGDPCEHCHGNKCECANYYQKKHKWVKLINQEKQLYVPASQEYPQNDELTENQYQIKQQESANKKQEIHRNMNNKSNLEFSSHSSRNNISGLNLNKSQSVVSIMKEKNQNKISHNLLDSKSRSSFSQQSPDNNLPKIQEKRQADMQDRRLSSQPTQHQKATTPDVPSIKYESVKDYQNKNKQFSQKEKTPISSNNFETKSHEKQSQASQKKSSVFQTTNKKKSNSDLRKIISSNSSSRDRSFNKTLPQAIHQQDQDKIQSTQSQHNQQKSSTKNSEKKSNNSQKKAKSIREMGTDPISFDQTTKALNISASQKKRDLSDSPRKQRISDWLQSNLYKIICQQKGKSVKDSTWDEFNKGNLQIFTEDEAQYNYSILQRIATEHDDIYDHGQLEMLSQKASNTIHVLCEHLLLSNNFAKHFQNSDQPFDDDPWSSQRKNTIQLNQLYKTLNIDTVIKLLLRVKMLYNTYTDVKQILCLIYHQQKMFSGAHGSIPDLINKILNKSQLSQREEKELILGMQTLEKLSRRIQQLKQDHKLFRNFDFNGGNIQKYLLEQAEIIYELFLDLNAQSLSKFTVPSLDQNDQLIFKKPTTGYQSKRQSLNQKIASRQVAESNKIDNNLQIFEQNLQPNEDLVNIQNESSKFGYKNSNSEIKNLQDADEELKIFSQTNRGQEITFKSSEENSKEVSDRYKNSRTYMNVEGGNQIIKIQNQKKQQNSDLQINLTTQKYQTEKKSSQDNFENQALNKSPQYISISEEQINTSQANRDNSQKPYEIPSPVIEQTFYQSQNEIRLSNLEKNKIRQPQHQSDMAFQNSEDGQSNSNDTVQNETMPKLKYQEQISNWNESAIKTQKFPEYNFAKPSKSVSTILTERHSDRKDIQQDLEKLNQKMSQQIQKYEMLSRGTSSRETIEQKEFGKFYEQNQFISSNQSFTTIKNIMK